MIVVFWIILVVFFSLSWDNVFGWGFPRIYDIFYWKYFILTFSFYFFFASLFPGFLKQSIMMLLVISSKNSSTSSSPSKEEYRKLNVLSPWMIALIHLSYSSFCLFSVYSSHISKLSARFFFFLFSSSLSYSSNFARFSS